MGRSILAVLLGVVVAVVIIVSTGHLEHTIYGGPVGIDPHNPAATRAAIANLPRGALALLAFGWVLATAAGAWLAAVLARRAPLGHALTIGALVLLAVVLHIAMIPHPVWVSIGGLLIILPAAYAGGRLARSGRKPGAEVSG